ISALSQVGPARITGARVSDFTEARFSLDENEPISATASNAKRTYYERARGRDFFETADLNHDPPHRDLDPPHRDRFLPHGDFEPADLNRDPPHRDFVSPLRYFFMPHRRLLPVHLSRDQ